MRPPPQYVVPNQALAVERGIRRAYRCSHYIRQEVHHSAAPLSPTGKPGELRPRPTPLEPETEAMLRPWNCAAKMHSSVDSYSSELR